ncbi:MAG: hypothetical protein UV61_C0013G0002 [Candidatus Gottesmanbacteria bacterium GW2011_GWB1_43_11]|uniref:Uncharacterized protein n=1 Tax=Candidatus Gottesmanbacteria bacterium GW2011_GWB1_43_11 TaxID=1618446 RepID=A0A0G1CKQ0_9BACT|nr:MAG: hypothetical protein UV17_C0029G0002 [Candidatus Gottesmanbacteria bacterium GW2011_GWA1_42_26]KKS80544.1 MAG: hypothetical protein UV55_C0036G0013 [Candidatus Gottesmanbacteria bacterium GW2011_GWC1_43_10]KKS86067.1 MAG: hypothetical protein UV61_C0013G0002 [Candidatus Gottesmanbacteria bacterium GW2011_GWB1_43_11]
MNQTDLKTGATKGDIEEAIAQITNAAVKALENVATKEDIKQLENKLEGKIDKIDAKTTDILRRVIDLEHDTPTQQEMHELKKFVGFSSKTS